MPVEMKLPDDHPLIVAWNAYQETEEYSNSRKWVNNPDAQHQLGSIWAFFMAGWNAANERAASLHESVNPASDDERQSKTPGAGAMGAVIEYRDLIRKT